MQKTITIISNSPQQTIELGNNIGIRLKGGEIIAISGALGSGKTHLIKGIASGAGVEDDKIVNSPTFVIVNEYHGRLDIFHIDAYRIESVNEFEMLGFSDFCYQQSVVLIEWADKVRAALDNTNCIEIDLEHSGRTNRIIHIKNAPENLTF